MKRMDIAIRTSAFILLTLIIWLYPGMWSGMWPTFLLAFAWGSVLSSFRRRKILPLCLCLLAGIVSSFSYTTFDGVIILFSGVSTAFITHSIYLDDIMEYAPVFRLFLNFISRTARSALSLLFGILFLSLPFPRSGRCPFGGGDITEVFWAFESMVIFMIIPVMVFDLLLLKFLTQRNKLKTHAIEVE